MLHKNIPYRRHQEWKHKKEARRWHYWWFGNEEMEEKWVGIVARTPQMCSCLGCGNQRRYEGETLDEIRSELELQDQLEELEIDIK